MKIQPQGGLLKQHLPQYLTAIKCRFSATSQTSLNACCPLHSDQTPSFSANLKGGIWLWKCHACDVGGTVIDLHARLNKLNPATDYALICHGIAEKLGSNASPEIISEVVHSTEESVEPTSIPQQQLEALTLPWRKTLWENELLRKKFANDLGIPALLLQQIASRSLNGTMGIAPAGFAWTSKRGTQCTLQAPRLVYIGAGYFKIRSPFGDVNSPRFMMFGHQILPWLSELLTQGQNAVKHVHIHESESSALALIAAGFWTEDNRSIVIATSGAGGFKPKWRPLFTGKIVHLWPDADESGQRFVNKTASVLYGTADHVLIRDWISNLNDQ